VVGSSIVTGLARLPGSDDEFATVGLAPDDEDGVTAGFVGMRLAADPFSEFSFLSSAAFIAPIVEEDGVFFCTGPIFA
jgi:hypothetical protein